MKWSLTSSLLLAAIGILCLVVLPGAGAGARERKPVYVGSERCQDCHELQYNLFMTNSKKAQSFSKIQKMKKKLTPAEFKGCCACHTTGYGEPGGFTSVEATPELQNPGCEVCHGPGSLHVESGDSSELVYKVSLELCIKCHKSERVAAFGFKPILYAGAH